jgi:hypothetical protein
MLYPVELRAQKSDLPMKCHDDMNKLCRFKPKEFRNRLQRLIARRSDADGGIVK